VPQYNAKTFSSFHRGAIIANDCHYKLTYPSISPDIAFKKELYVSYLTKRLTKGTIAATKFQRR
jgi:hypothetical protein